MYGPGPNAVEDDPVQELLRDVQDLRKDMAAQGGKSFVLPGDAVT